MGKLFIIASKLCPMIHRQRAGVVSIKRYRQDIVMFSCSSRQPLLMMIKISCWKTIKKKAKSHRNTVQCVFVLRNLFNCTQSLHSLPISCRSLLSSASCCKLFRAALAVAGVHTRIEPVDSQWVSSGRRREEGKTHIGLGQVVRVEFSDGVEKNT